MIARFFFFASLIVITTISHAQEKRVSINGRNFNVYLKGIEKRKQGAPVIIFESGLGFDHGNWSTITEKVAELAPIFAYDRSGVGKSDKVFEMPTTKRVAENLKAILTKLNIAPPYILVGHSMGGLYARGFAGYYPNDVTGILLIDPADFTESKEEWNSIFRKLSVPEKKIDEMLYNRLYQKSEVDSVRFGPWSEIQVLTELRRTDFAEVSNLPLPNVPIYFIVGGKFEVPPDQRSKDFDHEEFFKVRTNINIERWREFIYRSSQGGSLFYFSNAGHTVHRDDPKAVIDVIRSLLDRL